MKINRRNALRLWEERYGDRIFAEDFHGNLMCKNGYENDDYYMIHWGNRIYCGWNIHHILPVAHGGTNEKRNLICTSIATNEKAGEKITYWIEDCLYQVQRIPNSSGHGIYRLN